METILQYGLEDISKCFEIDEDLYQKYIVNELMRDPVMQGVIDKRNSMVNWQEHTPLGGPGTVLNGCALYALIRHYDLRSVLETGISGGFYSSFIMAALNKREGSPPFLTSIDISDDASEVGKFIPESLSCRLDWRLILGTDSLKFLSTNDRFYEPHQLFCHDSLHTLSHMMRELMEFKKSKYEEFFIYIDDQDSENFWQIALQTRAFYKVGYDVRYISGRESRLKGHLGGFIKYVRS